MGDFIKEGSQPIVEDSLIAGVVEVSPSTSSSILGKRKRDNCTRVLDHKNSRAPLSLCALRQAARLTPGLGRPSIMQDLPLTPLVVEAFAHVAVCYSYSSTSSCCACSGYHSYRWLI